MSQFQPFEQDAVRLLVAPILGAATVDVILAEATFVSYEYTGVGYFLTVKHPSIPEPRIVASEPLVIGRAGNTEGGFIAFMSNGEMMLECYSAGTENVPENFREQTVLLDPT